MLLKSTSWAEVAIIVITRGTAGALEFTRLAREKREFESLAMCALRYAKLGVTSVHEVFKLVVSLDNVATEIR